MNVWKKRSKATAIAFVLLLTFATVIAVLPIVSAHDPPWEIPSWAYMSVSPNPIGVNQEALIVFWLNDYPITAVGAYGDRWDNMYIDITTPTNDEITLGPYTSDPVGSGYTQFTPTEVGVYTLVFRFEGDIITGEPVPPGGFFFGGDAYIGDTYLPSQSDPVYLTVQSDPVEPYRETPLPEGYWTRPISGINRDWWQISGNWLQAGDNPGRFNRYSDGPGSSHIMWTRQYWDGGIMGGQFGSIGYYTGRSYEPFGTGFIALNGRLYYNVQVPPRYGWYAIDLRTGEELYYHNTTGDVTFENPPFGFDYSGAIRGDYLSFGQIYNYESPNQHGGFPYLWSNTPDDPTNMRLFDAFTGNYICSIANASTSGTLVYGNDGSLTWYSIAGTPNPMGPFFPDVAPFYLQIWNTSRAIWYEDFFPTNEYWMWRPDLGATFDGNNGYSLNVSIPEVPGSIAAVIEGEYLIGSTSGQNDQNGLVPGTIWALSLAPGEEGTLLWNNTFIPPYNEIGGTGGGGVFGFGAPTGPIVDVGSAVFWFSDSLNRKLYVYDMGTMQQIWESDPGPHWNYYGMSQSVVYGMLFNYGWGGVIEAYNITTGELLWNYTSGTLGFETAYENSPLSLAAIADEKLFMYSTEHSPTMPLARGRGLRCIDVNTGEELWQIHHWGSDPLIADGYLVDLNLYDNQIYCYGKGPSATTVTAAPKVVQDGSSVMIEGYVTDECAGAKGLVAEGKFSMIPAISDADMDEWMEYLYMQRPMPKDIEGVTVKLATIDPNGNWIDIGTVKSDETGMFKKLWEPEHQGEYTVIAMFEGSEAYAASSAHCAVGVEEAPSPAGPLEPEQPTEQPTETPTEQPTEQPTETPTEQPTGEEPSGEAPLISTEMAIVAAVAVASVIGVAAYWVLRRRK